MEPPGGHGVIPYGRQDVSAADIAAVVDILRSDFLTQGPTVPAFEAAVARSCGAGHAVAANSATSALHVACLALGVGPGDRVWTSPVTFVASANCARYCGADVDFVDIDPRSGNLSVERLAEKLERAARDGGLPRVVIPVHLCGLPCDLADIHALGRRYGFRIIEDASHALGGRYRGAPVGDGRFSDITVFSFHPVKIITTGEGGMAVTNDPGLARRMQLLRTHGITRDPAEMTRAPDGPWAYEQIALGFNYRMTDIQAALGLSQMQRLDVFVARRHALARRYDAAFADLPLSVPWQPSDRQSARHLYVVRLQREGAGRTRREVFEALRAAGVGVNVHYLPLYRHPLHAGAATADDFPQAERYYAEAISLPMYPALTDDQQDQVIASVRAALA